MITPFSSISKLRSSSEFVSIPVKEATFWKFSLVISKLTSDPSVE